MTTNREFVAIVNARDAEAALAALRPVLDAPSVKPAGRRQPRRLLLHRLVPAGEQARRHALFTEAGCVMVSGVAADRDVAARAVRALVDVDVHEITYDGTRGPELRMGNPTDPGACDASDRV